MFEGRTQQSEQLRTEDERVHVRSSQSEKTLLGDEGRDDTTHGGDRNTEREEKQHKSQIFLVKMPEP